MTGRRVAAALRRRPSCAGARRGSVLRRRGCRGCACGACRPPASVAAARRRPSCARAFWAAPTTSCWTSADGSGAPAGRGRRCNAARRGTPPPQPSWRLFERPRPAADYEAGESTLKSAAGIFASFPPRRAAALDPKIGRRAPGGRNSIEKYLFRAQKSIVKSLQTYFRTYRRALRTPRSESTEKYSSGPPAASRRPLGTPPQRIGPKSFSRRFATARSRLAQRVAPRWRSRRLAPFSCVSSDAAAAGSVPPIHYGRRAGRAACRCVAWRPRQPDRDPVAVTASDTAHPGCGTLRRCDASRCLRGATPVAATSRLRFAEPDRLRRPPAHGRSQATQRDVA